MSDETQENAPLLGPIEHALHRVVELVDSLKEHFVPRTMWQELLGELEQKLGTWCNAALTEIEARALSVVQSELAKLSAEHAPHLAAIETMTSELEAVEQTIETFPTRAEFVAMGFYADTYDFQKADFERRRTAASVDVPTFVDSVAGNDNNDGKSIGTALKTTEELSQRLELEAVEQTIETFPTRAEFVAMGFYADTYDFQKAEFERRRTAGDASEGASVDVHDPASPVENGPTDPAAGAPSASV